MVERGGKKLSLHDIAEISGVSPSTVSRVINGYVHVSEKTRRRVLAVIERYNYQPNTVAQALARQSSRVIGVVIPELVNDVFADPYFATLMQSLTYNANEFDYDITLWLTAQGYDQRIVERVVNDSFSDGLIIAEGSINPIVLDILDQREKTYLLIGRPSVRADQINYVDVENRTGGTLMTRYLIEQGRQRVGIIPGREEIPSAYDRVEGYIETVEAFGYPPIIAPSGGFTESGAYKSMAYLLRQNVDAVFCCSDFMALGAIRAIEEAGLRIPEDIAVGGFDDMPHMISHRPRLTTIRQPIAQVAEAAVRGLVNLLEGSEPSFQQVFPVELIIRESA